MDDGKENEGAAAGAGRENGADAVAVSVVSLFFPTRSLAPPIMARVEAPAAALLGGASPSSVRRLRLKAVVVDVSVEGSNVDANGAMKGAAADEVEDDAVDEEDGSEKEDAAADEAERAAADAVEVDGAVENEREAAETEGAEVSGVDFAADAADREEEEADDEKVGTAGSADFGSAAFASTALDTPRPLSSTRRLFALPSSVRLFPASSSSSIAASLLLMGGSVSDLTGVIAPPVPPNSFLVGSKRPRNEARPGVPDGLDEEDCGAREEMMGEGDGSCSRF